MIGSAGLSKILASVLRQHRIPDETSASIMAAILDWTDPGEPPFDECAAYTCDIEHFWIWIFIPVVLVMSIAGVMVPTLLQRYLPQYKILESTFFKGLQGVAAGFILSVAIFHCIGESITTFDDCITQEFGFPAMAALLGVISTWTIELLIATFMARRRAQVTFEVIPESAHDAAGYGSVERSGHSDDEGEHGTCPSETVARVFDADSTPLADLSILLFGLSFHTFFIGTALGMSDNKSLFFALLFHQFFEALALGLHLVRASEKNSWKLPIIVTLVFSLSGPFGGLIGVAIVQSICQNPTDFLIIESIFNSFAGGILIFVGCVHMIAEEFTKQKDVVNNWVAGTAAWTGVIVGTTLMTLIGLWA